MTPKEKLWHDAYWDLLYKNYCNLPISVVPDERKFLSFKGWWNNQVNLFRNEVSNINELKKELQMTKDELSKQTAEETAEDADLNKLPAIKPNIRIITGGKDGGLPWLFRMNINAEFLTRPKVPAAISPEVREPLLNRYILLEKRLRSFTLIRVLPDLNQWRMDVDPISFSAQNELHDTLDEGIIESNE